MYKFKGGRECSVRVMRVETRTVCVVRGVRGIINVRVQLSQACLITKT